MNNPDLHMCEFYDSNDERRTLYCRSMLELFEHVGPAWPVFLDGRRGVLAGSLDVGVSFLDADDAPPNIDRLCRIDFPMASVS